MCIVEKPVTIEGMNATFWIIGLVVLVVLAIIIMLIVGNQRGKSKTVSFDKQEEPKELTQQDKSGNYQAQGGFNFAPAKQDKEPVLRDDQNLNKPATLTVPPAVVPPVVPPKDQTLDPAAEQAAPDVDKSADVSPEANAQAKAQEKVQEKVEDQAAKAPEQSTDSFPATPEASVAPEVPATPAVSEKQEQNARTEEPVAPVEAAETPAAKESPSAEETKPASPVVPAVTPTPVPAEAQAPEANAVEPEEAAEPVEPETAEVPEEISADSAEALEQAPAEEAEADTTEIEEAAVTEESPLFEETVDSVDEPVGIAAVEAAENAEVDALEESEDQATEAAEAAQVTAEFADAAREQTPVPDVAPEPAAEPLEEIAPAAGRIGKLRGRLSRSQNVFGKSVLGILTAGDLDEDAWEDIEAMLIKADLGASVTARIVDELRDKIAAHGVSSEAEARAMLRETLIDACRPDLDRSIKAMPYEGKPAVVLVVGVNGTGKTTTTGKLARVLVSMGHKVVLGAADTFRAAAADQLETWGRRVGAETVRGAEGADPASIAFDAVAKGVESQADVVLVDTAGRLHTSTGLMDQLGKVKRVVEKKAVVDEVLLVLDSTVGQNGMQQARIFRDVVDITGVVLTKLDGTAKGGIVFQVQEELGVPVKLVGLGEGADDLAPFEVEGFVDALLG